MNETNTSVGNTLQPSSQAKMDRALAVLTAHKEAWAKMDIPRRIVLLDQIKQELPKVERRWVAAGLAAKEMRLESMAEGEEWYSLTVVYRNIRFLRTALQDIMRYGKPQIPGKVTTCPTGQVVAQVVPYDWKEALALPGMHAEVWMDPSVSLQNGGVPQASFYHRRDPKGRVCLVLAAGNFGGLIPGDFMYKLFVEGQVVAVKMNPVNAYLGPIFEDGFIALIKAGFLQILYGGAEEGTYLSRHPEVDTVHMTGSVRTFESDCVWSRRRRHPAKAGPPTQCPRNPISAELGNISPSDHCAGTMDRERYPAPGGPDWLRDRAQRGVQLPDNPHDHSNEELGAPPKPEPRDCEFFGRDDDPQSILPRLFRAAPAIC